jgi:hypothetical protein
MSTVKYYTSDKDFQVVRKLTAQNVRGENKKIEKSYPTWTGEGNFIHFKRGERTALTEEDLELPTIKNLIKMNVIRPTL